MKFPSGAAPGKDVEGARKAVSPADAAQGAEVVWMCVSDTKAVEGVLFGPQGVEESLAEGMTIVDSSTISPSATRQFAERACCPRCALRGCAHDWIESGGRSRDPHFYGGRRRSGDRIPETAVCRHG